jgi:hypothetical protein
MMQEDFLPGFASEGRDFQCPEAEFLDEIQTKVLTFFLLATSTALS